MSYFINKTACCYYDYSYNNLLKDFFIIMYSEVFNFVLEVISLLFAFIIIETMGSRFIDTPV